MDSGDRSAWTVELRGHAFDLEDLVRWTKGNSRHVAQKREPSGNDIFELVLPISDVGIDHEEAYEAAVTTLEALNGIVGVFANSTFEGATLAGTMYCIDADGTRRDAVVRPAMVGLRIRGFAPTVTVGGKDSSVGTAAAMLQEAEASLDVRNALLLVGRRKPTWSELYVAFEIVQHDVGSKVTDWAPNHGVFTATACNYQVLGANARHGPQNRASPKKSMDYDTALDLVRGLVKSWVLSRLEEKRPNS